MDRKRVILFLDFDGVCHPEVASDEGVFSRIKLIWQILRTCPHVDVVLSSSWREIYPPDVLLDFVTSNGGEDLAHRFVGSTPSILREPGANYAGAYHKRELECLTWLHGNGQHNRRWLALDDFAPQFTPGSPNLYLVDPTTGLTGADVQAIIARLQ